MLTKKSKVTCLTLELETGAEPIRTCLNRTPHLERNHLLPTVISRSRLAARPLPSITGQASFVLVDGWVAVLLPASSPPDVDALDAKDYRVLVAPVALPPQRHAHTASRLSPRLRLIRSIKAFPPYRQSGQGSHAPSRPSLPSDSGTRDTDTVLAESPSFPHFRAPYSDCTFRPASSRCPGILTRVSPDSTRVGRMLTDAGAAPRHRPYNPSSPGWAVSALESRPTTICRASLSR